MLSAPTKLVHGSRAAVAAVRSHLDIPRRTLLNTRTAQCEKNEHDSLKDDGDCYQTSFGTARFLYLNRPKQLNALNHNMVSWLTPRLLSMETSDTVQTIVVRGAGDKAFCAGGDIVAIAKAGAKANATGDVYAREQYKKFFRDEYRLNHLISTLTTPYIPWLNGVVMGGGVGLSIHNRVRVATEQTLFAMPETAIGFFPDVGGSHFLPRLDAGLGMYLGLTGARLKGADLVHAGVATHFALSSEYDTFHNKLTDGHETHAHATRALAYVAKEMTELPAFSLEPHMETIARCFTQPSVPAIIAALQAETADVAFAQQALKMMSHASPLALCVTHEQLTRGRDMDLAECLQMEYVLSQNQLANADFGEGVRAMLIDKDKKPKWKHASVADVKEGEVKALFDSLPAWGEELTFDGAVVKRGTGAKRIATAQHEEVPAVKPAGAFPYPLYAPLAQFKNVEGARANNSAAGFGLEFFSQYWNYVLFPSLNKWEKFVPQTPERLASQIEQLSLAVYDEAAAAGFDASLPAELAAKVAAQEAVKAGSAKAEEVANPHVRPVEQTTLAMHRSLIDVVERVTASLGPNQRRLYALTQTPASLISEEAARAELAKFGLQVDAAEAKAIAAAETAKAQALLAPAASTAAAPGSALGVLPGQKFDAATNTLTVDSISLGAGGSVPLTPENVAKLTQLLAATGPAGDADLFAAFQSDPLLDIATVTRFIQYTKQQPVDFQSPAALRALGFVAGAVDKLAAAKVTAHAARIVTFCGHNAARVEYLRLQMRHFYRWFARVAQMPAEAAGDLAVMELGAEEAEALGLLTGAAAAAAKPTAGALTTGQLIQLAQQRPGAALDVPMLREMIALASNAAAAAAKAATAPSALEASYAQTLALAPLLSVGREALVRAVDAAVAAGHVTPLQAKQTLSVIDTQARRFFPADKDAPSGYKLPETLDIAAASLAQQAGVSPVDAALLATEDALAAAANADAAGPLSADDKAVLRALIDPATREEARAKIAAFGSAGAAVDVSGYSPAEAAAVLASPTVQALQARAAAGVPLTYEERTVLAALPGASPALKLRLMEEGAARDAKKWFSASNIPAGAATFDVVAYSKAAPAADASEPLAAALASTVEALKKTEADATAAAAAEAAALEAKGVVAQNTTAAVGALAAAKSLAGAAATAGLDLRTAAGASPAAMAARIAQNQYILKMLDAGAGAGAGAAAVETAVAPSSDYIAVKQAMDAAAAEAEANAAAQGADAALQTARRVEAAVRAAQAAFAAAAPAATAVEGEVVTQDMLAATKRMEELAALVGKLRAAKAGAGADAAAKFAAEELAKPAGAASTAAADAFLPADAAIASAAQAELAQLRSLLRYARFMRDADVAAATTVTTVTLSAATGAVAKPSPALAMSTQAADGSTVTATVRTALPFDAVNPLRLVEAQFGPDFVQTHYVDNGGKTLPTGAAAAAEVAARMADLQASFPAHSTPDLSKWAMTDDALLTRNGKVHAGDPTVKLTHPEEVNRRAFHLFLNTVIAADESATTAQYFLHDVAHDADNAAGASTLLSSDVREYVDYDAFNVSTPAIPSGYFAARAPKTEDDRVVPLMAGARPVTRAEILSGAFPVSESLAKRVGIDAAALNARVAAQKAAQNTAGAVKSNIALALDVLGKVRKAATA